MGLRYAITNLIDSGTLDSVSSEDPLYVKEWLYDGRPSRPFRFTAKAAQWIKINLGSPAAITLAAIFNHNLQAAATQTLEANAADAWGPPSYTSPLAYRAEDEGKLLNQTYQWWRFYFDDVTNPHNLQIGDAFLGVSGIFANAHLQPGRDDGPAYFRSTRVTHYGQHWASYYGRAEGFKIRIRNLNLASQVDELQTFLTSVMENGGRFIIIPEESLPHIFYVFLENESDFASQIIRGPNNELREWRLDLRTLTKGITLI